MRNRRLNRAALAAIGAVAVSLAMPSSAQAKSDYGVTISGKHVEPGATVTVTVVLGDDGGIDGGARMCLFQIVGDNPPQPHSTDGFPDYAVPPGSRYVKVADCQRPARDDKWAGLPDYYSGTTKYRLRVSSTGWLALAAFREESGTRINTDGPILSNVVRVSGPGGAIPGAAAAETTLLSIDPPHGPATTPVSPPGQASRPAGPSSDLPASSPASGNLADGPPRAERAAREGRPKSRWLAAATGGLLLGGLITGLTMTLRSRARARKP